LNRRIEFLLGGFAVLVVMALLVLGRTSEASKVKAVVNDQSAMWNTGDVDSLYATMTTNAQQACPLEMLRSLASRVSVGPGTEVALKNINVRVQGGRAFVTGFVTVGGRLAGQIDGTDPAVYVKTETGWKFDSMEKVTGLCATASALG
jgi:hypothetical protein